MSSLNFSMSEVGAFLAQQTKGAMALLNGSMATAPASSTPVHVLSGSSSDLNMIVSVTGFSVDVLKAIVLGGFCAALACGYSEILYQGTAWMYRRGKLQRYYPLPTERHVFTAWLNAFSFMAPPALYALTVQKDMTRSFTFSPLSLLAHTFLYMIIHDVYFWLVHANFHRTRWLYDYFHAMHHEMVYAMNVFHCGFAEVSENFIQVGMPWILWTAIAGSNWFNWFLPLTLTLFTTLLGHSGYRMNWRCLAFHPLSWPVVLLTGKWMLTPGDHQVHHTYRRFNFGLFWHFMDKNGGTYKKPTMRAHDITYWTKWASMAEENSEEAKKWMGRNKTDFAEVSWGL